MKNKILKTLLFSSLFLGSLAHASHSITSCSYEQVFGSGRINLEMDISDEFSGTISVEYAGKKSVDFYININTELHSDKGLCAYIEKNLNINQLKINLAEIIELENAAGNGDNQSTQQIYLEKLARENGHRQAIQKVLEKFAQESK